MRCHARSRYRERRRQTDRAWQANVHEYPAGALVGDARRPRQTAFIRAHRRLNPHPRV
jgi:hypothetical protein